MPKEKEDLTPWQQVVAAIRSAKKRKKAFKEAKTADEKIKALYTKF